MAAIRLGLVLRIALRIRRKYYERVKIAETLVGYEQGEVGLIFAFRFSAFRLSTFALRPNIVF